MHLPPVAWQNGQLAFAQSCLQLSQSEPMAFPMAYRRVLTAHIKVSSESLGGKTQ